MPRRPRILSSIGFEHVMLRGVNKQTIFFDDADRRRFLRSLENARDAGGFVLHAYCLMDNHVHLLIQKGMEPVGLSVKRFGVGYACYFNKKYERVGHLFQGRYQSVPVESERQYLTVIRYIMQNPVKAGMCKRASEYRWSNYRTLGMDDGLADSSMLGKIADMEAILEVVDTPADDDVMEWIEWGRISDKAAVEIMKVVSGVGTVQEFLGMAETQVRECIGMMYRQGCEYKQIGRVLGVSQYQLERMRGLR